MEATSDQLDHICRVAHDNSERGAGKSLRELLRLCDYEALRPLLNEQVVSRHIAAHLEYVEQWRKYSEDKRTDGGWFFSEYGARVIGRLGAGYGRVDSRKFESWPEACAAYLIRELDYWLQVGEARDGPS